MISRPSATAIAEFYAQEFSYYKGGTHRSASHPVYRDHLYEFLFNNDFDAWFCNSARKPAYRQDLKEFIMKVHTGESIASATPNWSWEQRSQLGQRYLRDLAEDALQLWEALTDDSRKAGVRECVSTMRSLLELDGYAYRNGRLHVPESDVLDVEEEMGVLESLYTELDLAHSETAFHHLRQSEQRYVDGAWDDSIGNSRKFLESVLQNCAAKHSQERRGSPLPKSTYESPLGVRDYLESHALLEAKEKTALAGVYGVLSNTGGHPYIADNDQARLMRHLALTFAQFVMLRLQGSLKA